MHSMSINEKFLKFPSFNPEVYSIGFDEGATASTTSKIKNIYAYDDHNVAYDNSTTASTASNVKTFYAYDDHKVAFDDSTTASTTSNVKSFYAYADPYVSFGSYPDQKQESKSTTPRAQCYKTFSSQYFECL